MANRKKIASSKWSGAGTRHRDPGQICSIRQSVKGHGPIPGQFEVAVVFLDLDIFFFDDHLSSLWPPRVASLLPLERVPGVVSEGKVIL